MVVNVLGLVEESARRDPLLPSSARTTLFALRGGDLTVVMFVRGSSGVWPSLTGTTARMRVRASIVDDALSNKDGVIDPARGDTGAYTFSFTAAELRALSPEGGRRLLFDVTLVRGGVTEVVVPTSVLVVEP